MWDTGTTYVDTHHSIVDRKVKIAFIYAENSIFEFDIEVIRVAHVLLQVIFSVLFILH